LGEPFDSSQWCKTRTRITVTMTETAIDPRHPRRLEKKRNTVVSEKGRQRRAGEQIRHTHRGGDGTPGHHVHAYLG